MTLEVFNTFYLRFFAASVGLHLMMFAILYLTPSIKFHEPETIPVSILEAPAKETEPLTRIPNTAAARRSIQPAVIAKKNSLRLAPKSKPEPEGKAPRDEV